ncbi:hypothetical protein GGS26DRAFT_557621 [Hypomontagnella submonticulosa]|nr:hypothetical protein GGS26DRAFT_557621 [Hypomontagnella submonticulosa]
MYFERRPSNRRDVKVIIKGRRESRAGNNPAPLLPIPESRALPPVVPAQPTFQQPYDPAYAPPPMQPYDAAYALPMSPYDEAYEPPMPPYDPAYEPPPITPYDSAYVPPPMPPPEQFGPGSRAGSVAGGQGATGYAYETVPSYQYETDSNVQTAMWARQNPAGTQYPPGDAVINNYFRYEPSVLGTEYEFTEDYRSTVGGSSDTYSQSIGSSRGRGSSRSNGGYHWGAPSKSGKRVLMLGRR